MKSRSLTRPHSAFAASLALVAILMTACRGHTPPPGGPAPAEGPAPVVRSADAVARARADSSRLPYTAADIHFMAGMIHHHAQAIQMSRWAPSHGASSSVQTLASRIINAQQDEIHLMQQWLSDRNQPVPDATPGPMKMMMGGMEHEMLMPGMLSPEQLSDLDHARGEEFDRKFLSFMIQHHSGAVSMVKELFDTYGAAQDQLTFKLASDVQADQTTEIARMQLMLARITFGTAPSR